MGNQMTSVNSAPPQGSTHRVLVEVVRAQSRTVV